MADGAKFGAGHAQAMFRQGLKELRAVVTFEGSAAQPTEYGIFGTLTPGEVAADRNPADPTPVEQNQEAASSPLAARQDALRAAATVITAQPDRDHER